MSKTYYLGIPLTSVSDTDLYFADWRQRIDGDIDSDMIKIDAAIGQHTSSNINGEYGAHGIRVKDGMIQVLGDNGDWMDVIEGSAVEWGKF